MNVAGFESELVVLTADKNMKCAVEGLLSRPKALAIRPISAAFYIHPESDPGCLLHADTFLKNHGFNPPAFKALDQAFTGKIQCMYIDPPANASKRTSKNRRSNHHGF